MLRYISRSAVGLRRFVLAVLIVFAVIPLRAQGFGYGHSYRSDVAPTKNLIVMIPDGTSLGVLTAARWYRYYNGGGARLALDDYLCGTVRTFSSNSPIADSAPAGSAFMTGVPARAYNISIYPESAGADDLVDLDPEMAYRPLATLLEASRLEGNRAAGLVVKVEFPHATPASCAAHTADRGDYLTIGQQMANQDLDVMLGGGVACMTPDIREHLASLGVSYYENDIEGFRAHKKGKIWSLWCDYQFPYVHDHDGSSIPYLPEMTRKALNLLSAHKDGFFLMVEGSLVDWAGHSNDAIGLITEFLEFDDAVRVAMDFARADGNTTVVVMPDHGNSGFTMGNHELHRYERTPLSVHYEALSRFRRTSAGMEQILMETDTADYRRVFSEYTGIELDDGQLSELVSLRGKAAQNYMEVGYGENMIGYISELMNSRHYFGYTSSGHTGEDVFLAAYHSAGHLPTGANSNTEINNYMADALGLTRRLPEVTRDIFSPHDKVLDGLDFGITIPENQKKDFPVLWVRHGDRTAFVRANCSYAEMGKKRIPLGSVAVYMKQTGLFYVPADLKERLFGRY